MDNSRIAALPIAARLAMSNRRFGAVFARFGRFPEQADARKSPARRGFGAPACARPD